MLGGNPMDRHPRLESIRRMKILDPRMLAIVRGVLYPNGLVVIQDFADFASEGEIDRGNADLRSIHGIDLNSPLIEFANDHITGEDAHVPRMIT